MFFKDYIEEAVKTESNDFDAIGGRLNNEYVVRMLHAGLGMVTETSELFAAIDKMDLVNIREELGDLFWYIAIAYDSINTECEFTSKCYPYVPLSNWWKGCGEYKMEHLLLRSISEFIDSIKKNIFYGKPLERKEVLYTLQSIFNKTFWIMGSFDCIDLDSVLTDNIKKLQLNRYDGSFSEERALNRDVENELSHMKEK